MTQTIPPRARDTPLMSYYTTGRNDTLLRPGRFRNFSAEPVIFTQDLAAQYLDRNPHTTQDLNIKPTSPGVIRSYGYKPGMYLNKSNGGDVHIIQPTVSNGAVAKILKSRAFAEYSICRQAHQPSDLASTTCDKSVFETRKAASKSDFHSTIPLNNRELYITKNNGKGKKPIQDFQNNSEEVPDWWKVRESALVKNSDVSKAEGFDGTITLISKVHQWITVTPNTRNRSKRLGRQGPFNSSASHDFTEVSDLAPAWMQNGKAKSQVVPYRKMLGNLIFRGDHRRTFMVDPEEPEKSVFSYGDFRHNVTSGEEARLYSEGVPVRPKNILEWKEDTSKQKYDKPVAGKIGSL